MRILHVGNFGARAKGAFLHSVAPKLSRGLVRNGHQLFDFSDRDVAKAGSPFGWSRKIGVSAVNRTLTQLARDMRPDLLLLGHADTIRPATVADLRRAMPAMRVLQWNVDPLFEPDNVRRLRTKLEVVDATLVSTAGKALSPLKRQGMRLGFLPNPVDFSIESGTAHLQADLPNDLFYACGHPSRPPRHLFGRDWNMEVLLTDLLRAAPGTRANLPGLFGAPHLAGAAYQDALASCAVGLNASRRNDTPLYSSDRLAHMIGNGQAVLIDRATFYPSLFTDDELAFFTSFDELAAQLRRLTADKPARMALATAGRARYHALFNETAVAAYVVGVATGTHSNKDFAWPTLIDP
jgi:hypothetical protein